MTYGLPSLHLPQLRQNSARKLSASRRAVTLSPISDVNVTSGPRHSFNAARQAPTRCLRQASGPLLSRYAMEIARIISASAAGDMVCIGGPQPECASPCCAETIRANHIANHAVCMVNAHSAALIGAKATLGSYPIPPFIFGHAQSALSIPLCTEFTALSGVTAMANSTPRETLGDVQMVKGKSDFGTTKVDGIIKVHARRERLSALEKRARLAKAIDRIPERKLAESPDCTVQAVRKWKAEDQFPSGIALIDLSRDFDSVFGVFCEMAGREADVRSMHAYAILQQLAMVEGPDGQAARRVMRKIEGFNG